ncbi:aminopeptidase N [Aestuariivirga sp.]|uniref:aminopeptidase N n=1 Tax=Aestuariivirga sp. TaxID=2650926 RepID=UPI0039E2A280
MRPETPPTIRLKDYAPVPYLIETVRLSFQLDPGATEVRSTLTLTPNPASDANDAPLVLDGEKITLRSIVLDGKALEDSAFTCSDAGLTIHDVPQRPFTLDIVTLCNPEANTELSGLYMSNGMYCTQCEAEGFRRITYFYDRPDVMARFHVRMEAPKASMPVLLSNGNPSASGDVPGTERHFAEWDDPFPKPCYLFALVAGDLAGVHDTFITMSGRKVDLGIYVEKGKENRCAWAMEALKASMRWDEEAFGREYDLDVFNIVAVSAFNMGAMENKGLNIFNDKYILALPETATDTDYVNIEAIIAHEYFHNWTGNRITCRDWFQLCLKEGLTVFRDQEFTSDLRSRPVKRIADVKTLRARQFPEDGGPLAHPVRPSSYIEINNFYTPTVYEKGAELCRMMKTLIGPDAFRKAMDLYFQRHDGEAATIEQFVACMADASGRDLTQFFSWYQQAGTPQVVAQGTYDAKAKTYELTLEQKTLPTPGQDDKLPMHIPLGLGLVGPDGEDMPLDLEGTGVLNTPLLELTEARKTFRFRNVAKRPVLSLNRGFSAPINLTTNATAADQIFLMGHDRDSFTRWEAGQTRGRELILASLKGTVPSADLAAYAEALSHLLADPAIDDAFKAQMLALPPEAEVAAAVGRNVDTDAVLAARDAVRHALGKALRKPLLAIWERTAEKAAFAPDPASTARRSLRYAALQLLMLGNPAEGTKFALADLASPHNMTAEIGALSALIQVEAPERDAALDAFYARHSGDHLLVDKWFMLQAQARDSNAAARVVRLVAHPAFSFTTPNRIYALIGGFTSGNVAGFNAASGEGYRVVADVIIKVDAINPQVAARMATGFRSCKVLDEPRRKAAETELRRILATPGLSRDCYEIVSRIADA